MICPWGSVVYCVLSCVGQWSVPIISGQCPPPCVDFTLNELPHNRGIMFGGSGVVRYNDIYIIKLTKDTVVSNLDTNLSVPLQLLNFVYLYMQIKIGGWTHLTLAH